MTNINTNNNNHRNLRKRDVAIAGASGAIGSIGATATLGIISKPYYTKILSNQPVMFNNETEHFNLLKNYIKIQADKHGPESDFAKMSNKLADTGRAKKDLIYSAFSIYNSEKIKEARQYSDEFLDIVKMAQSENISNEKLSTLCEFLHKNKPLTRDEGFVLSKFLIYPEKRKELFSQEKFSRIYAHKTISKLSQNVVIDPDLVKLADQMSKTHNLKAKGVSYFFGTPKQYVELRQKIISDFNNKEQKALEELKNSNKNPLIKKIKALLIKSKTKNAVSKTNKSYNPLIKGTNAFYNHGHKAARVPLLFNLKEAIFHELGHAINFNSSKNAAKIITFLRFKIPRFAIPTILISSLFLKKSNNSEEKKGPITETREFIKNHIMSLSLAISAPMVLEEGLASARAVKFLKGKVNVLQLKNTKKSLFVALGSYGIVALSTALTLKFGVWISDKIQSAKQNSSNN